jgi:putative DNA-invertase from lambdoid prophage Rac
MLTESTIGKPSDARAWTNSLGAGDVLVLPWVERLGRNYEDFCDAIRQFMGRDVVIRNVINNFIFDGAAKDPMQKAAR